jgi:HEPN domain-containing protein
MALELKEKQMHLQMRPPSDGESALIVARQLLEGANVLAGSSISTPLPGALLSAQALESGLKAFLWSTGSAAPHGHDLEALWLEAVKKGLGVAANPTNWCVLLNTLHAQPYKGRYPSGLNGIVTPNAKETVEALTNLVSLAGKAVQAAPWRDPFGSNR